MLTFFYKKVIFHEEFISERYSVKKSMCRTFFSISEKMSSLNLCSSGVSAVCICTVVTLAHPFILTADYVAKHSVSLLLQPHLIISCPCTLLGAPLNERVTEVAQISFPGGGSVY
jgi:hypothetical protein